MTLRCLIVQPMHDAGLALLRDAGVEPVPASGADMRTVAREIVDCHAVITRNAGLDRAAMDAAPHLLVIGNHGVGVDPIDLPHAATLGIPVVNTPHANAIAVAEHATALVLALAKQLADGDRATRAGDFAFKYRARLLELHGATLGVIGFGEIGRRTAAALVRGVGMRLLVHAPRLTAAARVTLDELGGRHAGSLDELLAGSDVVTLHVPLRDDTRGMIDARALALMRPDALLVNTARGPLVDEDALVDAVRSGHLGGVGLDVYASERMPRDHPLLALERAVLTPHVAGSAEGALRRTATQVAEQVVQVLRSERPAHLLDPDAWARRRRR